MIEEFSDPTSFSADDFPGAEKMPLEYPGRRPDASFCYVDGMVSLLEWRENDLHLEYSHGKLTIHQFLARLGAAPLSERYLVLAIGSNACPGRLKEKFPPETSYEVIPVLRGEVPDLDTVYCAMLTDYAALPATSIALPGNTVTVWGTLLSATQLARMNESESVGSEYELVKLDTEFRIGTWQLAPVYAYYCKRILLWHEKPARVGLFSATNSPFPALNQREILTGVLDQLQFHPLKSLEQRHHELRENSNLRDELDLRLQAEMSDESNANQPGRVVDVAEMKLLKLDK